MLYCAFLPRALVPLVIISARFCRPVFVFDKKLYLVTFAFDKKLYLVTFVFDKKLNKVAHMNILNNRYLKFSFLDPVQYNVFFSYLLINIYL